MLDVYISCSIGGTEAADDLDGIATLPEVTSLEDLDRVRDLASNLQVPEVSIADLHTYAERKGDGRRLNRLASLIQEGA